MEKPVISGDTIQVPSSQDYLADVDLFIEATLRGYGADESVIADIAISVSELVNNAIMHGNRQSKDKVVTVRIRRENGQIKIAVTDQGSGFDPSEVESPIDSENLMKAVGRGIFIVRSLMDALEIKPSTRGTTVTIAKTIS
jgi:serine/threonine-protein kinase RsbW